MLHLSLYILIGCDADEAKDNIDKQHIDQQDDSTTPDMTALQEQVSELQQTIDSLLPVLEQVEQLEDRITELEGSTVEPTDPTGYTDADALAAIQNDDPWSDPDAANIQNLWSKTSYGYQFLENSRWTMDNRSDPAGQGERHEMIQIFHETPECTANSTFADCNATAGLKMYVNGPQIVDHDWSAAGFEAAAVRTYNTHASGMYMVSFGQLSYVTDMPYGLIPPSGIHLEPHGAHQALRIDGSGNSGENIRIDTTQGSKGIAIYESPLEGLYCDALGIECTQSHPLYIRGGMLHLEDIQVERTVVDARNAGVASLHTSSLGIEHFYSWHIDSSSSVPVHCTWNEVVTDDSIVKVQPYSSSPDLQSAHSYVIVDVWGPGNAPAACTATQNIKTDAAGVYGHTFSGTLLASGGFSVAILGATTEPLDAGAWQEQDRPAFLYEVIEPLSP